MGLPGGKANPRNIRRPKPTAANQSKFAIKRRIDFANFGGPPAKGRRRAYQRNLIEVKLKKELVLARRVKFNNMYTFKYIIVEC